MANRVIRSLVSAHLDQERKWASWAQADRQARSLNLVHRVALGAIRFREAQDPNQAPIQGEPASLNPVKTKLLEVSQKLMGFLGTLVEADPRLAPALKNLQVTHKKLESWSPSAYPSQGSPQASRCNRGLLELGRTLARHTSQVRGLVKDSSEKSALGRIAREIKLALEKIAQPSDISQNFQHFKEKFPRPRRDQPHPDAVTQEPQTLRDLRVLVNEATPILQGYAGSFKDDPQGKGITKFYAEFVSYLNDILRAKNASSQDIVKAAGKFQRLLRMVAAFLYRNRTASAETRNASIKSLASIDAALNEWNEARLSTSIREAQNILTRAYQKLQKSAGGKLATTPPVLNLKLAWNELEVIDRDLGKSALMDMSDNSKDQGNLKRDQGKLKDLVEQMENADPQELGEAIEEVMDKSSSKIAKGKRKTKKTPQKRQKTQKKKKRPAIGDDPWCGKKPTFDSAFKKVNHARSQLSKLMARLAETSLVRGDVRYALSMLEKVLEAMQRC